MLRYLPFILLFFLLTPPLGADPAGSDCPEGKSAPPAPEVGAPPAQPSPSVSPQEGPAGKEPSTVKEQMGLIFDPASTIPDKPIVEEKNPERKKLLDKIFEAEKREVDAKVRLDGLSRMRKDLEQSQQKIYEENKKLFKEWDEILEKKAQRSIFRSLDDLDKATGNVLHELDVNSARLDGLQVQLHDIHREILVMIDKWGNASFTRSSLQESLDRMDAAQQKEVSKQDTGNAPVPVRGGSRK